MTNSEPHKSWKRTDEALEKRTLWTSIRRGLACRCPNCGEGRLFAKFLKVVPNCPVCNEDYSHQRADDLPAYLDIIVVAHIIVPLILVVEQNFAPPIPIQLAIYLPLTLILGMLFIQPIKGAIVGLQWALRMHGFGGDHS